MQGKVSIVVPCYNKERYIGAMLRSVLAQKWDNIELILVNDGSTDGTRAVIEEFIPKILDRGYEYKLIDQENRGLAGTVKEGLRHISGEYCCSIDSDDEIMPEYISLRAGFLDAHPEYDWATCGIWPCENPESGVSPPDKEYCSVTPGDGSVTENFILMRINIHIAQHLVRSSYLRKCEVVERFYVTREGNQEVQFALPLAEGGGKIKHFPRLLYKYNQYSAEHSQPATREEIERYVGVFGDLYRKTVDTLDITDARREYLQGLCDIFELKFLVLFSLDDKDALSDASKRLCALARRQISTSQEIEPESILRVGLPVFVHVLGNIALGRRGRSPDGLPAFNRVIGYSALGRAARSLLPALEGTPIQPHLLWDRGGPGTSVTNQAVTPPDIDALGPGDLVLLFPRRADIVTEMTPIFESKGCRVLQYFDILDILAEIHFGDMLKTARFLPGGGA